jgi:hypothetical protein
MEKKMKRNVVIRANMSGVWFGTLVHIDAHTVDLENAKRVWSWEGGALSCSEIAIDGITGGKLGTPVSVTLLRSDCFEIIESPRKDVIR